jgi:topoisomerase-4 subunit A
MAAKRKIQPAQPELPIEGAPPPSPPPSPPANGETGNGAQHVQAEQVETPAHAAFVPGKIDLPLHRRVDRSFLDYASYVIRDRAIPSLIDGLKPVQRRILWTLHEKDDGRFIKVATVAGAAMQYHPHGDASINDALVVLANKRYLIEGQGNFGNIYTGDVPAAGRYIECRLTELARHEIFNDEITDLVPSYDSRSKEPVTLPSKLPLLLMLGTEGIAVGMSARILPHNFPELLEAQIAILKKQPFKVLPDFQTGGLMDAREYRDGAGQIKVRAKLKIKDESTVLITQIPPTTTTDSLIASIEDASRKGKIKVKSIHDFTSEDVEIEVRAPSGISADQLADALYAFTDCEVTVASRIVVIKDNRPVELTVSEVLRENTTHLLATLQRELELKASQLEQELHFKTLVRLFIENRLYKKIEQAGTNEAVTAAVREGFEPFRRQLRRALTDEDLGMLLGIHIRRISLFDINRHRQEMDRVKANLEETRQHLRNVTKYAVAHLEALLAQYGPLYPRCTKSSRYDEVDAREVAFKAFKCAYDRESGYIGHKVSGEEFKCECTKFDKLLMVFRDGHYKVTELPEKMFVGPELVYAAVPERDRVMTLAYTNRDATYLKRFTFGGAILDKEYFCIPPRSRILFFEPNTPAELFIRYKPAPYQKINQQTCKPGDVEVKSPKTRGRQISIKEVGAIAAKPPRGWDPEAPTTKLEFI